MENHRIERIDSLDTPAKLVILIQINFEIKITLADVLISKCVEFEGKAELI